MKNSIHQTPRHAGSSVAFLLQMFHVAFMAGCAGLMAFCVYILYRQSQIEPSIFDASIINKLQKSTVIMAMVFAVVGSGIAGWNITSRKRRLAVFNFIAVSLILICIGIIIGGYWYIAKTEGRFLHHSRYFRWYLYATVPLSVCTLAGLIGLVKLWRQKY